MNASEFVNEVRQSEICPVDFDNIYKEFMGYQKMAIDALAEFHNICEKRKITYSLAYGSLLGAIRDNGQIPWDYDVDVIVPYEEKAELINALKSDLSDEYYFYCAEVDSRCRHFFIRITPKGFKSEALHVDVFILAGTPENLQKRSEFIAEIKTICRRRFYKLVNIREEAKGHPKLALKLLYGKVRSCGENIDRSAERYSKLCSKYEAKSAMFCIHADFYADSHFFSKSVWDTKLIRTDIGMVRIPVEYNTILKSLYGDYNVVPSLKSRLDEMQRHYKKIKYHGRKENDN